jgi:hypothetical protein
MSEPAAAAPFSAHAPDYTGLRRRLVPGIDELYVDLETQLGWLRAAGVVDVGCVDKSWRFAVMAGFRR